MNLISVDKISKEIGSKVLFNQISFGINEGERIGILGINGSGKTTLLKILAGLDIPDSGQVMKNKILRIAVLSQSPSFDPNHTVLEHIFSGSSSILETIRSYEAVCERLDSGGGAEEEYNRLMLEMDRLGAWELESWYRSLLKELNIRDLSIRMGSLSGGMLKKVALVQILIEESNLLVLDEPTNHLDVDTILWLQDYLIETKKAVLLVTHDRYFLEEVTERILELENGSLFSFPGNFGFYLEKKNEAEVIREKAEQKEKQFLKKELEWLRRQPKARGTKQKGRTDRALEVLNRKKAGKEIVLDFSVSGKRLGKKILELKNLHKSYHKSIISNFSYTFKNGERIGIVGPNGSGKSTLLDIIVGRTKPDSGDVSLGMNTSFGYFDQVSKELSGDMRVIEYIKKECGVSIKMSDDRVLSAADMLELFLFDTRLQAGYIKNLSGGEKRRLYLVSILMTDPNFLILDEPTNDLDIRTLSVLEEFLTEFGGCVLVVSHDRYFMDRTVDYLFIFQGEGIVEKFPGNYSEYLEYKNYLNKQKEKKEIEIKPKEIDSSKTKKGLSFNQKKELDVLETEIFSLEEEERKLTEVLQSGIGKPNELATVGNRLMEIHAVLPSKLERWEELQNLL
ncbi:ABC-F family ATP-binding cassette domain-containing protein [Leptospira borgpetersenii serovar Hardjo-bovis]|uniref:ABC transporter, ATP-binding protein n=1 Tax=Leptospira borgpetersenii serovar Hardjo-bovis str. Sponselee TaxID=1303729 RepID=M6C437_LEPBO|nr:ABC-F family ATP-binding cassette domain-containing protein [Leptospira borgpetersenii]ABJ79337.1 ATP-binding protein of an ABC transporter complex [Leptospira borgpetersenii serovar Hardjo-bovis str. L550]AMX58655.1 ABC transporter ATP-binding protein [Leptospira borgpetersenii serovar Hardjo]AMX61910.1 ABC transporter ATP-binding protein [Leptospira borgpetersenii serovar Hardjo]AMX65152.1 ABC transporter ATP-binding protein [Leptospira borgpetersenii serovar Hardjo]AMX68363.1 ABC transpo